MADENDSFEEDFSEIPVFTEDEPKTPKQKEVKRNHLFDILTMEKIMENVFEMVEKVQNFLGLPLTNSGVRALLAHYKWDYEALIQEYFEASEACGIDEFFSKAKVMNPYTAPPAVNADEIDSNDCKICCDTFDDMYGLECGHKFCRDCWAQYLTQKIVEEGLSKAIVCLEPSCPMLVDDENVVMIIDDPEVLNKYHRSMTEDFVVHHKSMQWCPSADCLHAARKKASTVNNNMPWSCECGYDFCFDCMEYWHEPVSCSRLNRWKNSDDSASRKWIVEHSKPCPQCKASIEKNGGCNHMTCRMCRYEFCWICMGLWRPSHACNRFDETQAFEDIDIARFQHFQERYVNQLDSLKKEANIYRNVEARVDNLKDLCSWTNNQTLFLREAIKVLHVSRRTLTYTFVFAYFLKKNNEVEIFEENQSDLERKVETLAGYLEQEITSENADDLKTKIQESFKYCENRCKVLMEHINEAEENNSWEMK